MKKRFVLSGYYGFKNFGDEAILSVLVNKIKAIDGNITVISSDPQYTKSKYKHIHSIYTFKFFDIICAIAKSDVLISGGGSLLQDVTSVKSLIYYLCVIFTGIILRKKVIIFAQGIGPINNFFGKYFAKTILKLCTYVSVRDAKSQELLKKWGINSDLLCDPVFSTKIENYEKDNVVAVQLRDFKTMNEDFIDRLAMAVCHNFSDMKVEIYSFQDSVDLQVCNRFKQSLNLLNSDMQVSVKSGLSDEEIIEGISKSKYLIGMRFHALIIGLLAKTKVLGINYDVKVARLASEFQIPTIELRKEFFNEFDLLKTQDTDRIIEIVRDKNFDWSGFEKAIN